MSILKYNANLIIIWYRMCFWLLYVYVVYLHNVVLIVYYQMIYIISSCFFYFVFLYWWEIEISQNVLNSCYFVDVFEKNKQLMRFVLVKNNKFNFNLA